MTRELREKENIMAKESQFRVKIVEKAGIKLKDYLSKQDENLGQICKRTDCYPCTMKPHLESWKPCWKRNLIYRATCLECESKGMKAEYIGESGKTQ